MIFHHHKAVHFHIGRTAGTSIEIAFQGERSKNPNECDIGSMFGWYPKEGIFLQHATVSTFLRMVPQSTVSHYHKFAVVRNPFSRLASCYWYLHDYYKGRYPTFEHYVYSLPLRAKESSFIRGCHISKQIFYTHHESALFCDQIIYFEQLPDAARELLNLFSLSFLPKENSSHQFSHFGSRLAECYSPTMKRVVQDLYEDDFREYRYTDSPEVLEPVFS